MHPLMHPILNARAPLAGVVLVLAAACADAPNAPRDVRDPGGLRRAATAVSAADSAPDGYLVLLNTETKTSLGAADADVVASLARVAGVEDVQPLGFVAGFVARGDVDVAALEADPRVARVTPNSLYYKLETPAYQTGALFWRRNWQWNMRQIRAEQAAFAGGGRTVCVIDGGTNKNHQDLAGKVAMERAFPGTTPYGPDDDFDSHGTHVGSTVTSNGIGVASVAPAARLMNANVFGPDAGTSVARITDAMAWCSLNGADVINMSLGGARTRGTPGWVADSTTYTNAAQAARALGTVVVAAAGNSPIAIPSTATNGAFLPAEATGVVAVGATAPPAATPFPFPALAPAALYDAVASYSARNSGNDALGPGVIVYAPGGNNTYQAQANVTAACAPSAGPGCSTGDRYFSISGTSMASPHVAGVAALIASRTGGARSLARVRAIEACLVSTSDVLAASAPFFGRGRLNAQRATTESCPGL